MKIVWGTLIALTIASAAGAADRIVGSFSVHHKADAMTDEDRSSIVTFSSDHNMLAWQCRDDGLNLIYHWGKYLSGESDTTIRIQIRFNDGKALDPLTWDIAGNNQFAFAPMFSVSTLTDLAASPFARTVTLRVFDGRDGEIVTDTFDLTGLRQALAALPCSAR